MGVYGTAAVTSKSKAIN